ncbi:hypothetical protein ACFP1Z_32900 [Streptomyces gamaensis]|uniref:MgtC-like C-terminal domain-containing protein n=1 Tax=Streptomyces gamaensis TaxID=1763542 RepID=A0ABW0ZBR9_9ACTN
MLCATLHALCSTEREYKARALCVLGARHGTRLMGLRTSPDPSGGAVHLWVTLGVDGAASVHLEELISRLSAEPGVRDLHWRLHSVPTARERGREREREREQLAAR